MDFFSQQRSARARTRKLVVLLVVALLFLSLAFYAALVALVGLQTGVSPPGSELDVQLVLWNPPLLLIAFGLVATLVSGAALYKYLTLREGGAVVARNLGGRLVLQGSNTPTERKLLNVVEEMALASGIAMPAVYVLDEDEGINAFAAGFSPNEAVIGVTRGTIERLTRDELQGVIAHEFSHILNGDMRLNLRLIALIHGLIFMSLLGELLFRSVGHGRGYGRGHGRGTRSKGDGRLVATVWGIGAALWVLGLLGVLCSRIIKSSISREREFLADASAVQFTRNPNGIAGALKRILYGPSGDAVLSPRREEISHFLFSNSVKRLFSGLMATHPPLPVRIARIDPSFSATEADREAFENTAPIEDEQNSGATQFSSNTHMRSGTAPSSAAMLESIGTMNSNHVAYAHETLQSLPQALQTIMRDAVSAKALVLALSISSDSEVALRQFDILRPEGLDGSAIEARETIRHVAPELRLPLAQLALGALSEMSKPEAQKFLLTLQELCVVDQHISFFELAVLILVRVTLQRRFNITAKPLTKYFMIDEVRGPLTLIFSRLAEAGSTDSIEQKRAFDAAMDGFGDYAKLPAAQLDLIAMSEALDDLRATAIEVKQQIVTRMSKLVMSDESITIEESELFRAICAGLDVPVPPWLTN